LPEKEQKWWKQHTAVRRRSYTAAESQAVGLFYEGGDCFDAMH
jgi:hypothetical protein